MPAFKLHLRDKSNMNSYVRMRQYIKCIVQNIVKFTVIICAGHCDSS